MLRVLLFLFVSCLIASAVHGAATPYGKEFIKLQSIESDVSPIVRHVKKLRESSEKLIVDSMKNLPDLASSDLGPYASELIEYHQRKGLSYLKREDELNALTCFLNALHLVRVTEGLYSENQKSIIRNIQSIYYLQKDFKSLARTYEYLFQLNGGEKPPFDSLKLEFILEYLEWRRDLIKLDFAAKKEDLLDLYDLNKRLIEEVTSDKSLSHQWNVLLSMSQLSNLYLILHGYIPVSKDREIIFTNEFNNIENRHGQSKLQRLMVLADEGASIGRRLLEKSLSSPELNPTDRLYLLVELGDWFQWLKRSIAAQKYYRQAYQLSITLSDAEAGDLFSVPKELPNGSVFFDRFSPKENKIADIISVDFEVLKTGKISNIEVKGLDLLGNRKSKRIIRKLKNTRFRPQFRDGKPVDAVIKNRNYEVF